MEHSGTNLEGASLAIFRSFADKIGWMADRGIKRITGSITVKGDAEDWFLSPVGADAVRSTDEPPDKAIIPEPPAKPVFEIIEKVLAMSEENRKKLLDSLTESGNQPEHAHEESA